MKQEIMRLLDALREAIHEAICESPAIAETMAELEGQGLTPEFSVGVTLPPEQGVQLLGDEQGAEHYSMCLNEFDQAFLRDIGITVAS
jgi:hypothetical protein